MQKGALAHSCHQAPVLGALLHSHPQCMSHLLGRQVEVVVLQDLGLSQDTALPRLSLHRCSLRPGLSSTSGLTGGRSAAGRPPAGPRENPLAQRTAGLRRIRQAEPRWRAAALRRPPPAGRRATAQCRRSRRGGGTPLVAAVFRMLMGRWPAAQRWRSRLGARTRLAAVFRTPVGRRTAAQWRVRGHRALAQRVRLQRARARVRLERRPTARRRVVFREARRQDQFGKAQIWPGRMMDLPGHAESVMT